MRYKLIKKSYFVYLSGKSRIPHLPRYQGLAAGDYGFVLDALNLGGILDFRSFRVKPNFSDTSGLRYEWTP